MGRLEGIHQSAVVLRLQRGLHFLGPKREEEIIIGQEISLNDSADPPSPYNDTNIRPLTLGKKYTCLDNCRCGDLERMGIPGISGFLRRWAAME